MGDGIEDSNNLTHLTFGQAMSIWWASTWRYLVISMGVGLALTLSSGVIATFLGRPLPIVPEDSMSANAVTLVVSAVVMMFALRQALLADFHSFSLTVLEEGNQEPGRIHSALGAGRMLRIWWATAWPLHLLGQGLSFAIRRFGLDLEAETGAAPDLPGCGPALLVLILTFIFSVACLWRAVGKRYKGFRLAVLLPWSAQHHL